MAAWQIEGRDALSATAKSKNASTVGWNQGDMVVNWGAGDATSGDRTAPQSGSLAGAIGLGSGRVSGGAILVAVAIIAGALLWKRLSH